MLQLTFTVPQQCTKTTSQKDNREIGHNPTFIQQTGHKTRLETGEIEGERAALGNVCSVLSGSSADWFKDLKMISDALK